MRVIGFDGEQLGIISLNEALALASKHEVDLVEISPNAQPPVAKIVDWGKYQYQILKKAKKNRQNSKADELKQMRFRLKIGDNDLQIKLKKVSQFLAKGNRVRITIVFRGREMAHKELGQEMIDRILELLSADNIKVIQKPQFNGRNLSITIRSK